MRQKILVVGGTGFIGHNIIKSFSLKKYKLFSISKKIPHTKKIKGVCYIACDITNFKKLKKKIIFSFDHIINLSGNINHSDKKGNFLSHYIGTKNLVNIFKSKKIISFILIVISLEYGNQTSPQKESHICRPIGSYAKSKLKASNYIQKIGKKKEFPYIILRAYQIYGPGQKKDRLIPMTIDACYKNKKFNCTSGLQKRDFIFIEDFVNLIKKILIKKKIRKKVYNVGTGKPLSVKFVIKKIKSYLNSGKPQFGLIPMRKDESKTLYPSIKKVSKDFKWSPRVNLSSGLKKTILLYGKS